MHGLKNALGYLCLRNLNQNPAEGEFWMGKSFVSRSGHNSNILKFQVPALLLLMTREVSHRVDMQSTQEIPLKTISINRMLENQWKL